MTKKEDNIPRHGVPKGERRVKQELLYDPNVATPSHAEYSMTMACKKATATLCTISKNEGNYPYGSFVTYAMYKGNPIFLISKLAEHTKNLQADSKSSLLIAEGGDENPLALGRVTLVGDCTKLPDSVRPTVKSIFLEKHPSARFGRLITGDNCKNINIDLVNTKTIGLGEFVGTKNCTNIVINKKKYR